MHWPCAGQLEGERNLLQAQLGARLAELQVANATATAHDERIAQLEAAKAEADSSLAQSTTMALELEHQLVDLRAGSASKDAMIAELQTKLQQCESQAAELQALRESAEKKAEVGQGAAAEIQKRLKETAGKVEHKERALEAMRQELTVAEASVADWVREVEGLRRELEASNAAADADAAERGRVEGALRDELEAARAAALAVGADLVEQQRVEGLLKGEREAARAAWAKLEAELSDVQKELDASKGDIMSRTQDADRLRQELFASVGKAEEQGQETDRLRQELDAKEVAARLEQGAQLERLRLAEEEKAKLQETADKLGAALKALQVRLTHFCTSTQVLVLHQTSVNKKVDSLCSICLVQTASNGLTAIPYAGRRRGLENSKCCTTCRGGGSYCCPWNLVQECRRQGRRDGSLGSCAQGPCRRCRAAAMCKGSHTDGAGYTPC
jgi:golgin subfamily B member 1